MREFLHVAAHFLRCNLRVNLRRADAPVSEHFRERFDRYVVRQADGRRIAVAAHVPRDVLFDTALLRYCLDASFTAFVTRNGQQLVPFGHAVVFLDDMSGDV